METDEVITMLKNGVPEFVPIFHKKMNELTYNETNSQLYDVCPNCTLEYFIKHYYLDDKGEYLLKMYNIKNLEKTLSELICINYKNNLEEK